MNEFNIKILPLVLILLMSYVGISYCNVINITTTPPGAIIYANGRKIGVSPYNWHSPRIYGQINFKFTKYGYLDLNHSIEYFEDNTTLNLSLKKIPTRSDSLSTLSNDEMKYEYAVELMSSNSKCNNTELLKIVLAKGINSPIPFQNAIENIIRLDDTIFVTPLIYCLENSNDAFCRAKAAYALGKLKDKRAVKPLRMILVEGSYGHKNKSFGLTANAITALMEIKPEATHEFFVKYIKHSDRWVQEAIIKSCETMTSYTPEAEKVLITTLEFAPDWESRRHAAMCLKQKEISLPLITRLYYYMALNDRTEVNRNWSSVKKLLLQDLSHKKKIQFAVTKLLWIGKEEILSDLIGLLENQPDLIIINTYLNSGHPKLVKAAKEWAMKNGHKIESRQSLGTLGVWGGKTN